MGKLQVYGWMIIKINFNDMVSIAKKIKEYENIMRDQILHIAYSSREKVLNESLSINKDVIKISNEIKDKILANKGKEKSHIDEYNRNQLASSINVLFNDNTIIVNYTLVLFSDYNEYKENMENYNWSCDTVYRKDNKNHFEINIISPLIDSKIPSDRFEDSIFHEIAHVVEMIKRDGTLFNNKYNSDDYKELLKIISDNTRSREDRAVATCLYVCRKYERAGFVHGLYGTLYNYYDNRPKNIYRRFTATKQYKYLKVLKMVMEEPAYYADSIETIAHRDYVSFAMYLEKQYKKYMTAVGRVIYQIYNRNLGYITEYCIDFNNSNNK